ncbi:uncharacterized protein PV09_03606 [Verruconis gallopava]|uniref:Cyclase n=1 Tax=Verruconis gallopava TaxID=253628 RepID=A0A0D2AGN6_9PEZI|nr:uncharacterized protein PV09_03606 [Verruconis gallopava]KIW05750.1 hypothetical protein PV09_03606 [Verruconis gallopava]
MKFDPNSNSLPKRSELPDIPGAPKGVAWFWGDDDELGRLNLLTNERRLAAAKLITTGETINLDWQYGLPDPPTFKREPFKHTIKPLGVAGHDDLYELNTQSGSQWDGFRHVGLIHNDKPLFYNNLTKEEVTTSTRCGVGAWAKAGIVGRGVLIDYWSYAQKHGKSYDPMSSHQISVSEILACAKEQGVEFKYGDIFITRTGFIDRYMSLDRAGREALVAGEWSEHKYVGVEQSEEMLDFLHDNYFAAVAGDQPSFETWPFPALTLHSYLLPRWGSPIGEMFDVEALAEACKKYGRYEFFFVSSPANVPGGVGSWPNAMAIF